MSTVFIYLLTGIYKHAVWVNCSCPWRYSCCVCLLQGFKFLTGNKSFLLLLQQDLRSFGILHSVDCYLPTFRNNLYQSRLYNITEERRLHLHRRKAWNHSCCKKLLNPTSRCCFISRSYQIQNSDRLSSSTFCWCFIQPLQPNATIVCQNRTRSLPLALFLHQFSLSSTYIRSVYAYIIWRNINRN